MNAGIVRLFGLVVVLYGVLVGFTSYWSVFDAEGLEQNLANRRPLLEQQRIHRGEIRTRDGELIAVSNPRGSGAERVFVRSYPEGELFGHPVGYSFVQRGQTGVERSHNDELVGEESEFLSILDQIRGHRQEGDNLISSIDADAQRVATNALGGRAGSVVAIEPQTGLVRTLVSVPGYDPNQVPEEFAALNRASGSPLFDRATQSGYPPGSAFKVVTASAALDSGEFTPDSVLNGDTDVKISGVPLSNAGGESFGQISLTDALTNSVNTVWAQVGERLGDDTLYKYMSRFGFNRVPELDYPKQQMAASGVFDGNRILTAGDRVDIGRVAIGQERLKVTPLQMAEVAAAVSNEGELMRPRLWERVIDPDGRTVAKLRPQKQAEVMKEETARTLAGMMSNVVQEGTGTAAALAGIDVAGKTGTAERGTSNQAWMIAFAPVDDPQVAVAVTVEKTTGSGGTVAGPIAKQVMESLLE
jgi:peptidoglycan glycosyltransferase